MHVRAKTILLLIAAVGLAGCSGKSAPTDSKASTGPATVPFPSGPVVNPNPANILLSISPTTGGTGGGTAVTLKGTGFFGNPTVEFDGLQAVNVQWVDPETVTCVTPAHPEGMVDVVLTLEDGTTGRLNNAFLYDPNVNPPARVADYGDPTGEEQEFLELVNQARRNPTAAGQRLGLDFSQYPAIFPICHNEFLAKAALLHTEDMAARAYYDHVDPDGVNANGRILDSGYALHPDYGTSRTINLTENIGVGQGNLFNTPQSVFDIFMKETNSTSLKHRENMLGVGQFKTNREVGTGYRTNLQSTQIWEHYGTFEYAHSKTDKPFLFGTVYADNTPDNICRAGEGRSGVTVTLEKGSFKLETTTKTAGGYGFEVFEPGLYTLTIDGQSTQVEVKDLNVKVDMRDGQVIAYATPALQ